MLATSLAPGFYSDVPISHYTLCYETPLPVLTCSLAAVAFSPFRVLLKGFRW